MGHDILLVRYDTTGKIVVFGEPVEDQFVTWSLLQWATVNFDSEAVDECWVAVTKEDALRAGMTEAQFEALLAQCKALGGQVATNPPVVVPPPPVVPPAPTPLVSQIEKDAAQIEADAKAGAVAEAQVETDAAQIEADATKIKPAQ